MSSLREISIGTWDGLDRDLALSYGLDPALKPTRLDISETVRWLGYKPSYSLANLLSELAAYGDRGPPPLTEA